MLHLQTLKTLPALCHSLSAFSLYTSAFASVSKCFISSPPSVHHALPPFSPSACMDLLRYFTFPLSQSLHPRAVDEESGCEQNFTCTSIRNGQKKIPPATAEALAAAACIHVCVCMREGVIEEEGWTKGSASV